MKFRKKPVVIEALQWDGSQVSARAILDFIGSNWWNAPNDPQPAGCYGNAGEGETFAPNGIWIKTLEGKLSAYPQDWVIRGVKGEFYPCKPDIFELTYESAAVAEDALARLTPLAIIGARHNHEDCIEAVGSHPSGLHYGSFELCENKNCVLVRTPAPDRSLPDPES